MLFNTLVLAYQIVLLRTCYPGQLYFRFLGFQKIWITETNNEIEWVRVEPIISVTFTAIMRK